MEEPKNLFTVYHLYATQIEAIHSPKKAKVILIETRAAILRPLLTGWGYSFTVGSGKITIAEMQAAFEFMKTIQVKELPNARLVLKEGLNKVGYSQKNCKVFTTRIKQFLNWCQEQSWWPIRPLAPANTTDESCPTPLQTKVFEDKNLTLQRGHKFRYTLQPQEISSLLQAELEEFEQFLTSPEWPGRVTDAITQSGANNYLSSIRLMLGWFNQYQGVSKEELSLSRLIPKLTNESLSNLSEDEQQKRWKRSQKELEAWLCKYLTFLREIVQSQSPRTKIARWTALSALGRFLYYTEIEDVDDYDKIPVLKVIAKYSHKASVEIAEWERQKRYVADQELKWPDPIEGKTGLSTVREQVLEPLRKECRFKTKDKKPRGGSAIATSLQRYLVWSFLANMPARRQEELRSLKLSLCCPIKRPQEVPSDGLYHPLPPLEMRSKRYDGSLEDNYLYKTYVHKREFYAHGVWVLDIQKYKTFKMHGPQSIVIPNRQFGDGTYLYDYIERYLYGWWLPGGRNKQQIYDWWLPELMGCRGRWVTQGRIEFNPKDLPCTKDKTDGDIWSWGYLFVRSSAGVPFKAGEFALLVENSAHRVSGKYISPHTMRSIWATWAYQVQLTDQQKESLAYAMGHTLKTLKTIYERCTPEEKRRPIEEAIDEMLFKTFQPQKPETPLTPDLAQLAQKLEKLTGSQREQLLKQLKG
ncbi:hypothetical protein NDA03_26525 [Trichocoleus sp. Lan]|uniref:hypothetical protein n=1 Tax=Trichocoleus sp. Lan TaxID=2933927 RepID=UPI00329A01E6